MSGVARKVYLNFLSLERKVHAIFMGCTSDFVELRQLKKKKTKEVKEVKKMRTLRIK